jgi:hypothetical protein
MVPVARGFQAPALHTVFQAPGSIAPAPAPVPAAHAQELMTGQLSPAARLDVYRANQLHGSSAAGKKGTVSKKAVSSSAPAVGGGAAEAIPPTMPSLAPAAIAPANNSNVTIASSPAPLAVAPVQTSMPLGFAALSVVGKYKWQFAAGAGLLALALWWFFFKGARKSNPSRSFGRARRARPARGARGARRRSA